MMATYFYKDVFKRAINDVEYFYDKKYNFSVKVQYADNRRNHASIIGRKENSLIRFSKDCCDKEIESPAEFLVALFIVSHELAHYINHHNYIESNNDEDNRIIEAWADNFGTKLLMLLITHGKEIIDLSIKVRLPAHSGERINLLGNAFDKLCTMFFNNQSNKYHYRIERLMNIFSGVCGFLYFNWGGLKLDTTIDTYLRLYKHSNINEVINSDFNNFPVSSDDFDKIISLHYPLQNGESAITLGLKKEYRKYIDTSFVDSIEQSDSLRKGWLLSAISQAEIINIPDSTKESLRNEYENLCRKTYSTITKTE